MTLTLTNQVRLRVRVSRVLVPLLATLSAQRLAHLVRAEVRVGVGVKVRSRVRVRVRLGVRVRAKVRERLAHPTQEERHQPRRTLAQISTQIAGRAGDQSLLAW